MRNRARELHQPGLSAVMLRATVLPKAKPVADRQREESVENYLMRRVKEKGGRILKLQKLRGWPDRLILLGKGRVWWVECKRPKGGRYEPLQERVAAWLSRNRYNYCLVKTHAQVDTWISTATSASGS